MSITLTLLLFTTPSDLCDVVEDGTGIPLLCKFHPEGAPIFDGNVCCTQSSCTPTLLDSCQDAQLYYCYLGELRTDGDVDCYVEVPNYCDIYACEASLPGYQAQPVDSAMCCSQGVCWHHILGSSNCELGDIFWCDSAVSNPDGTATCLDE